MRVVAIAHLTLVELWRQRTQWGFILLGAILALPALIPADSGIRVGGAPAGGAAVAEALLGFAQFVAVFLAISSAGGLVAHDLERGTGLLLLSKPLARWQILLGKMLGAGLFMALAWLAWGLIAASSIAVRFGGDGFWATVAAFAASTVASWLVLALCLLLSTLLPASAVMGLGVIAWIVSATAPKVAGFAEAAGYDLAARALRFLGEVLPIDPLSELARRFITGEMPQGRHLAPALLIAVWWVAAAIAFQRRDLATSN